MFAVGANRSKLARRCRQCHARSKAWLESGTEERRDAGSLADHAVHASLERKC